MTITAFCTYREHERAQVNSSFCNTRSQYSSARHDYWHWYATGGVNNDNVLYRINEGQRFYEDDMWDWLLRLGTGCHWLQMAEDGISTHWSEPYRFCLY